MNNHPNYRALSVFCFSLLFGGFSTSFADSASTPIPLSAPTANQPVITPQAPQIDAQGYV